MSKHIAKEYLSYVNRELYEVKCMKCLTTLGKRRDKDNKMVKQVHAKKYIITLEDKTHSCILLCKSCYNTVTDADLAAFQKTQRWGWQKGLDESLGHKAPLSLLKKHFYKKNIVKRGL